MKSIHHSFDIELAAKYGVEEAIIIHHFQYWIRHNQSLKRNFHEGYYWTYQSLDEIAAHFPYMTKERVVDIIDKLCTGKSRYSKKKKELDFEPVLKRGNFNKSRYDRTVWYSFYESSSILGKPNMAIVDPQSLDCGTTTPIPDTKNTDTKTINNIVPPVVETSKNDSLEIEKEALEISQELWDRIKQTHPTHKPPNLKDWAKTVSKAHRIDHRSWDDLRAVLKFSFEKNDFWSRTLQSAEGLRKHFDKIWAQMRPATTPDAGAEENREIAQKIKKLLISQNDGHLLILQKNYVMFQDGDSISFALPKETFEEILVKRFGLRKKNGL